MGGIQSVRSVFTAVRTAGFHVLDHSCFWVALVPDVPDSTEVLHTEALPNGSITDPLRFPTLDAAVSHAVESDLVFHQIRGSSLELTSEKVQSKRSEIASAQTN